MTINEVLTFYKNAWGMRVATGLSHTNVPNWKRRGYIPIQTQLRIQVLSDGKLIADLKDCKE